MFLLCLCKFFTPVVCALKILFFLKENVSPYNIKPFSIFGISFQLRKHYQETLQSQVTSSQYNKQEQKKSSQRGRSLKFCGTMHQTARVITSTDDDSGHFPALVVAGLQYAGAGEHGVTFVLHGAVHLSLLVYRDPRLRDGQTLTCNTQ